MESLRSNDQLSPRPLTREAWAAWVSEEHPKEKPDESIFGESEFPSIEYDAMVVEIMSDEIFERITKSPILKDSFLIWPEAAQLEIVKILEFDWDPIPLGIRYALRERLNTLHPEQMDWIAADYSHILMFGHIDVVGIPPDGFDNVITEFCDFQNAAPEPGTDPTTVNEIPCLLIPMYGYERVIDAMILWTGNSSTNKLERFVELVEKWNDFEYPREWMLNTFD